MPLSTFTKAALKTGVALSVAAAFVGHAHAGVVTLTWTTTLMQSSITTGMVAGEAVSVTLRLDNGADSIYAQSWQPGDLSSIRYQGASGWWFDVLVTAMTYESGVFETDASGAVIAVGAWNGLGDATSSWGAAGDASFYNNGYNALASFGPSLFVNDVMSNQTPSRWTAALANNVGEVPEPGSLALAGAALLGGLAASRRRKTR